MAVRKSTPDLRKRESTPDELHRHPPADGDQPPPPCRPQSEDPYHEGVARSEGTHHDRKREPRDEPEHHQPVQQQAEERCAPHEPERDRMDGTFDHAHGEEQRHGRNERQGAEADGRERRPHQHGTRCDERYGHHGRRG